MFSIEKIHPAVRIRSYFAIAIAIALGLTALGATIDAQQAHASQLQTASVKVTLPGGGTITVPDGSSVDLSGAKAAKKKATKKTATAVKKAKKYFKASGLQAYAKKYGWSLKSTWTKKGSTKAVCTREFAIPAKLQKQGKSLRMRVTQTTWHNAKGWHNRYTALDSAGKTKTFSIIGIKGSLKDYGRK